MNEYLKKQKRLILGFFNAYLNDETRTDVRPTGIDENVISTLIEFSSRGKMLRGGLVQLGYSLFKEGESVDAVAAGACLELLQSALLIHDDIMDRDKTRRNKPSLYYQYNNRAAELHISDSYHTGESMGICAGDIAFFTGIDMLSGMNCTPEKYKKIVEICSREMILVGMAQMEDVFSGTVKTMASREDIFELYRLKTGRYTFSLPLSLGAALAEAAEDTIKKLCSIGEKIGIVFQIKDDELGLFSSEEVLGKPIGGDLREGKKTIFMNLLYQKADKTDKARLETVLGNRTATEEEVNQIRKLIEKYEIRKDAENIITEISAEFQREISELSGVRTEAVETLQSIHDYNLSRTY